jgi:hypothetical protein
MLLKAILFPLGYIVAWFVLLPVLVVGGGIALFVYAVVAELAGKPAATLDPSSAREIARRLCGGYEAPARDTRRLRLR